MPPGVRCCQGARRQASSWTRCSSQTAPVEPKWALFWDPWIETRQRMCRGKRGHVRSSRAVPATHPRFRCHLLRLRCGLHRGSGSPVNEAVGSSVKVPRECVKIRDLTASAAGHPSSSRPAGPLHWRASKVEASFLKSGHFLDPSSMHARAPPLRRRRWPFGEAGQILRSGRNSPSAGRLRSGGASSDANGDGTT